MDLRNQLEGVAAELGRRGLYVSSARDAGERQTSWQVGEPLRLDHQTYAGLQQLGSSLFRFMQAVNEIYWRSLKDERLHFAQQYLDIGKGEMLQSAGRLRRLRQQMPLFLRPDVMLGSDGLWLSEIDAVPGGFGSLGAMQSVYAACGFDVFGGAHGITDGFMAAAAHDSGVERPRVGIVVSEESADYRPEMADFARTATEHGHEVWSFTPRDVGFHEDGLFIEDRKLDVLYRFFELFDIKNVPKSDLFLYAMRKQSVRLTPPVKTYLEEKLLFALFRHPALRKDFQDLMGEAAFQQMDALLPPTWIVDARKSAPQSFIHGLEIDGRPLQDFRELKSLSKRERQLVLKPSGFSPLGWGSRGVRIGPDLPGDAWAASVDEALASYGEVPWVLQRLMPTRLVEVRYFDQERGSIVTMPGRVRLCPYYMRVGEDDVRLAGALVTAVPADKKLIHGMVDAVMMPLAADDPA